MADIEERWYRSICANDKNEFTNIAGELRKNVKRMKKCKGSLHKVLVYDSNVLPHCVIYNRPELIGIFNRIIVQEGRITNGSLMTKRAIALAKALGFNGCVEQLEKMKCRESGCYSTDESPLDTLFTVNTRYTVDFDVLVSCLRILSGNCYHVNTKGSGGKTFFHDIMTNYCTIQNIKAMIEYGADINYIDENGETPLIYLLKNANHHFDKNCVVRAFWSNPNKLMYRHEFVSIVKLCLYANPLIELNPRLMEEAFVFDKTLFEAFGASDERFWWEYLMPVLHSAGFGTSSDMDNLKKKYSPDAEYVKLVENKLFRMPRKLEEISRIVLRQTYPGYKIKQLVERESIPTILADYLLMKHFKDLKVKTG